MPTAGAWVLTGGAWKREGRADRPVGTTPAPYARPAEGPGVYALENLAVGTDFMAAMAKVKTLTAAPDGSRTLTLPPMEIEAVGFGSGASATSGTGFLFEEGVSVVGSGPEQTVFSVTPDTITQAQVDAQYPGDVYPATIGLRVIIVPNATAAQKVTMAQFGVRGTQQRVNGAGYDAATAVNWNTYHYNGMNVTRCVNPTLRDIKVWGIPGFKNSPPGETFGVSVFRGSGAKLYRVEVDGRNDGGTRVGGAGIATNTSASVYLEDCYSHHQGFSHGFAFWETNSVETLRCTAVYNGSVGTADLAGVSGDGFNMERSRDVVHRSPTVGHNTLCELRYYARNDGDDFDGDTAGHHVYDLNLIDGGPLNIRIDNLQTTLPVLHSCPAPVYDIN